MPNTLTLTFPIPVPNVRTVRIDRLLEIDEANASMRIRLSVEGPLGKVYSAPVLTIANGSAQGVRPMASPSGFSDIVEAFTSSSAPTAFDDCMAAYKAGGRNGLLAQLQTLGLVPAGVIS